VTLMPFSPGWIWSAKRVKSCEYRIAFQEVRNSDQHSSVTDSSGSKSVVLGSGHAEIFDTGAIWSSVDLDYQNQYDVTAAARSPLASCRITKEGHHTEQLIVPVPRLAPWISHQHLAVLTRRGCSGEDGSDQTLYPTSHQGGPECCNVYWFVRLVWR
jgi:hypothetical protein